MVLGNNPAGAANKTISVKPLPNGDGWQVQVSGARESTHRTKKAAMNAGKRIMRASDTLKVFKSNGSLQRTVKGPRA